MPKNTPGPRPEGEWVPIPDYEGIYEVSDDGRVWSVRRPRPGCVFVSKTGHVHHWNEIGGHVMQQELNRYGYPFVALSKNGKATSRTVHRLVLEAFVGPCPEGMEACHDNDDPTDNRLSNLRWDTHQSNIDERESRREIITHCKRGGHEYTPENTRINSRGGRSCRECYREQDRARRRRYRAEKRAAAAG